LTMNKRAQQAIIGLLFAFVLIATMSILISPIFQFIQIGINATNAVNATNGNLIVVTMNTIPVVIVLVVLIACVMMITGR